ncbi:protein NIM1-INTERACTING 3 [Camellia sinensis]|uniref:protein NIM1-INTERACTING 3 n=1 Tax=Camellia sinensis TaxID=4442 RepID=UPI0010360FE3|nr:protein NIM1-INTERACTING 3 [Camellia sinensis]
MDAESRKRKMENEEEDDDEEKMQKFFALIRSTRDARERFMSGAEKLQEEEKKKGKPAEAWNPSFQPEDFMEGGGDQSKGPPPPQASLALALAVAGPSKREDEAKEQEQEEEEDHKGGDNDGLDLKLSLFHGFTPIVNIKAEIQRGANLSP